jgi:hypothetical protein
MESLAVALRLHESRERVRALLIPDPVTGRIEADAFPRSAVMRFILDSRSRRVSMGVLSALLLFVRHRRASRRARVAVWPRIAGALGTLVGLPRH